MTTTNKSQDPMVEEIRERLDYINAHADMDGAKFSTSNTIEILGYANSLIAINSTLSARIKWLEDRVRELNAVAELTAIETVKTVERLQSEGKSP